MQINLQKIVLKQYEVSLLLTYEKLHTEIIEKITKKLEDTRTDYESRWFL